MHQLVSTGQFPLLNKLLFDHSDLLQSLLDKEDDKNRTPLALAAQLGEGEAIHVLIKHGANPNYSNSKGQTPLHFACKEEKKSSINALAYHGEVKDKIRDKKGRLPEELIKSSDLCTHLREVFETRPSQVDSHLDLPPKYLSLQGGGMKGVAYAGVIKALEERKILGGLEAVAGTSAGAITASLLAFGFNSEEIKSILLEDLTTLIEHGAPKGFRNKLYQGLLAAIRGHVNKGDKFEAWINQKLKDKIYALTGERIAYPTLGDLNGFINQKNPHFKFKHLYVVATRFDGQPKPITFSSENPAQQDIVIASLIRASMSIPFLFEPKALSYQTAKGAIETLHPNELYVDGGLLCNLPDCFDRMTFKEDKGPNPEMMWYNPRVWYLSFQEEDEFPTTPSNSFSFIQTCKKIKDTYYNAESLVRPIGLDERVTFIDRLGFKTTQFDMSKQDKERLIQSGYDGIQNLLQGFKRGRLGRSSAVYDSQLAIKKMHQGRLFLSPPHPDFFNRSEELKKLEQSLLTSDIPNSPSHTTINGPSGYGKSQLAKHFAWKHLEHFSLVWEIDLRNPEATNQSYRKLAQTLEIPAQDKISISKLIPIIHKRLESHAQKAPYLIIFDNSDQMSLSELSLPKKGGHVIITTQNDHDWPFQQKVSLKPFSPQQAVSFIEDIIQEKEDSSISQLAKKLEYIPILLHYAAYHIATPPKLSPKEYLQQLLNSSEDVSEATAKMSLQKLKTVQPAAARFLSLVTLLSNQKLPKEWISNYLESVQKLTPYNRFQLRQTILGLLKRFALITYYDDDKTFSFHKLLQNPAFKDRADMEKDFQELIRLYIKFPQIAHYNPVKNETIDPFREVFSHTASLIEHAKIFHSQSPWESTHLALTMTRFYLDTERDIKQAEVYLNLAKEWGKDLDHPIQGRITFFEGMILRKQKNYTKALESFEKARSQFQKYPNPKDYESLEPRQHKNTPEYQVAICLQYQAETLLDLEQYCEASSLYLQAKEEFESIDLPLNAQYDIARIIRDQGKIQVKTGEVEKGITQVVEAIEMQKQVYGKRFETTPTVGSTYRILGDLAAEAKDFEKADSAYQKAIDINEKTYKTSVHQYVIDLYRKRAHVLEKLGKKSQAQELFNKAKSLQEKLNELHV